jgi:predicted aspartyl protease
LGPVEDGARTSFTITAWAEGPAEDETTKYVKSAEVTAVYTLDNPFTVTIKGKDTGKKQNPDAEDAIVSPIVKKYYKGEQVSILPPVIADEAFEKWESADGIELKDPTKANIVLDGLDRNLTFTAVYNPIIKEISVEIEVPKAKEALADAVTKVSVTVTGTYEDFEDYFDAIEWTPETKEDGKAGYNTSYTAKLTLKDSAYSDMKFQLAASPVITINNGEAGAVASLTQEDGKYVMNVTFPETEKADLLEVVEPDEISITREQAKKEEWNLPETTEIVLADGSEVTVEIEWTDLPVFDVENTDAQVLTAVGQITLPAYVKDVDGQNTVEIRVNVNVAAESKKEVEPEKKDPDSSGTADTSKKAKADKTVNAPNTADAYSPFWFIVVLLLSGSLLMGIVAMRKKK